MSDESSHLGESPAAEEEGGSVPFDGPSELGLNTSISSPISKMGIEAAKIYKRKSPQSAHHGGEGELLVEDDERPIGSLFKLKKPRVTKKPKTLGLERPRTEKADPGEMNDTLASFKKKLKAPKSAKDVTADNSPLSDSKPQSKNSMHAPTNDRLLDENMDDSLSALFQRGSVRKFRSPSKKLKSVEMTPSTHSELERSEGPCLLDEGFASPSDTLSKPLVPKRRGRKPRRGSLANVNVFVGVGGDLGRTSRDGSMEERLDVQDNFGPTPAAAGLVAKRPRGRPRKVPVLDTSVDTRAVQPSIHSSHGEVAGLVAKRRGRKPRHGLIAERKAMVAGHEGHSDQTFQDGDLGPVVKRRGRTSRNYSVAVAEEMGSRELTDQVSHDRSSSPLVKRRGRKPRHRPIAEGERNAGDIEYVDQTSDIGNMEARLRLDAGFMSASNSTPKGLVFKRRDRAPRNSHSAEIDGSPGGDDDLYQTPCDENLDESLDLVAGNSHYLVHNGKVGTTKYVEGLVSICSRSVGDPVANLVQEPSSISDVELKSGSARLVIVGPVCFNRSSEGSAENPATSPHVLEPSERFAMKTGGSDGFVELDNHLNKTENVTCTHTHSRQEDESANATSPHQMFTPASVLEPSETFAMKTGGSDGFVEHGNHLNKTENVTSTHTHSHQEDESANSLNHDSKLCSSATTGCLQINIESTKSAFVSTWLGDDSGFRPCIEESIVDIPPNAATVSSPVKDGTYDNSSGSCGLGQDSFSAPPAVVADETVRSSDVFNESVNFVPEVNTSFVMQTVEAKESSLDYPLTHPHEEKTIVNTMNDDTCTNHTSALAFGEPAAHTEILLAASAKRLSEKKEEFGEPLEPSKITEPHTSLDLYPHLSAPVQAEGIFNPDDRTDEQGKNLLRVISLTECIKKDDDVDNYCCGLNQQPKNDAISVNLPFASALMQAEKGSLSIEEIPQYSTENLPGVALQVAKDGPSEDLSLPGCIGADVPENNSGLSQPPIGDLVHCISPLTPAPTQTAEDLQCDAGSAQLSSEKLSESAPQFVKGEHPHDLILSDCFQEEGNDRYIDGLNHSLTDDPIPDKSPPTPVSMQTVENLRADDCLPHSFTEDFSFMTSEVGKPSSPDFSAICNVLPATGDSSSQFVESQSLRNQHSEVVSKDLASSRSREHVIDHKNSAVCFTNNALDLKETNPVDMAVVSDRGNTDSLFTEPRAPRHVKRRRQGDMAYEGDVDWEVLMHDHGLLANTPAVCQDPSARTKEKPEPLPHMLGDVINEGVAAVAAGLKVSDAGPIEKLRFKDLLKRKSGLQEYLQCRNMILDLWSKDVKRILPLADCGVSDAPSEFESRHASLVREIYIFLDRNGYINAGIASSKEAAKPYCVPHSELSLSNKFNHKETHGMGINSSVKKADFVVDEVRLSDNSGQVNNEVALEFHKTPFLDCQAGESESIRVVSRGSELSTQPRPNEHTICDVDPGRQFVFTASETQSVASVSAGSDMCPLDGKCNLKNENCNHSVGDRVIPSGKACEQNNIILGDALNTESSLKIIDSRLDHVVSVKQKYVSYDTHHPIRAEEEKVADIEEDLFDSTASHLSETSFPTDLDGRKKIVVVGAGPAGLTAARHLQHQGFSVTVIEARDRIGGRVYTDRSSLSVPVDLGASIITGVEADVATERRPDPSSLICSQLGLELTVLNSDCPLYDIVTGHKVPTDLDEDLEAEYNSLLDDMMLFVAQKGEHAMRMSLEDGLECALRRRRIARPTSLDSDQSKVVSDYGIVDDFIKLATTGNANGSDSGLPANLLSPLERRVMDWHFANLEYGCAALLKEVSLPYWNQDDEYGGFGGAHCMIRGGYSTVVGSVAQGLNILLNHAVTEVVYSNKDSNEAAQQQTIVKVRTSNGSEFSADAVLITVPLGCLKANAIKFSPVLPNWKQSSIQKLGFGVLNKVVMEFPEVFWDDTVDYFGATAEETDRRGQCFMFWNVKKTVGAPVLIALVVGKAAIDGQNASTSYHVSHAMLVLRKLFGEASVPDPIASVVTNWGVDPYSRGAYSYVALGASGEDYDILGKPVANCLFFAGEATCKEHPDTVGGAMISGLREAVRIIDILSTGRDFVAEVEAIEAVRRHSDSERNELRDMSMRLEACELSRVICKNSSDGIHSLITKETLLQDMLSNAKTTSGRLHLAKELLRLPVEALKSFAGTKDGLRTLNSWILDSLGKNATQLLRHCVRLLVLVSTDLLAVRVSGIGKTVKEKVCVHTSRDIRAIASQLVTMWIEIFRKEKASNGRLKLLKQTSASDTPKPRPKDMVSGKPPLRITNEASDSRGLQVPPSMGSHSSFKVSSKKTDNKAARSDFSKDTKSDVNTLRSHSMVHGPESKVERSLMLEETSAFAAAEAARVAALAAAEAYTSSEVDTNTVRDLPKIPSFHKFARREQYAQTDDLDIRKKWSSGIIGRQDCLSEIDSRNCKVRDWSVDFSAACGNFENSKVSGDNYSKGSQSNELACTPTFRENSGESGTIESKLTKAWVDTDTAGNGGVKDSLAIERWQLQAMDADAEFFSHVYMRDEEDSNIVLNHPHVNHQKKTDESSASQGAENKSMEGRPRGQEHIKQGVVDYVSSLLMPLYKTKKIDKEGYKSIMKKTTTKVMDLCTEAEKVMRVSEFLDSRRKNKIRSFVDRLIERHMTTNAKAKS